MTIVDWVLIGAVIVFAWAGWRQGFVAGALSFAGFLGGGIAAALFLPRLVAGLTDNAVLRAAIVIIGVIVIAIIGQAVASMLGRRLRGLISWTPIRFVDSLAGAGLAIVALIVIAWIIASVLAFQPQVPFSAQVQNSAIIGQIDRTMPPQVREAFRGLRTMVGTADVPHVFSVLGSGSGPEVSLPDAAVALGIGVTDARPSVVRVTGRTEECREQVSGSGFVYESGYVLTNAHVVAGVIDVRVQQRASSPVLAATVVAFDPKLDVAVLHVPSLDAPALSLRTDLAQTGDEAVAAGFPGGGPYAATPVRIKDSFTAQGDDIYGASGVDREVYSFRGAIEQGDSGGPLLTKSGDVLGMVFASGADETGYAITTNALRTTAGDAIGEKTPVATGSCRIHE